MNKYLFRYFGGRGLLRTRARKKGLLSFFTPVGGFGGGIGGMFGEGVFFFVWVNYVKI